MKATSLWSSSLPVIQVAEERHSSPLSFYFPRFMRWDARRRRSYRSLFGNPFRSFHRLFMPLPGMERDKVWHGLSDGFFSGSIDSMMDPHMDTPPNEGTRSSHFLPESQRGVQKSGGVLSAGFSSQ